MRVILLHAPPWKIGIDQQEHSKGREALLKNVDFLSLPLGLLSLHAEATRAGHHVTIYNVSNYPWQRIVRLIERVEAELFGLSCFTVNRHGVSALASLIKSIHPRSHVVAGGPFVTAFPTESLAHFAGLDTVVVGEGEATFLELIGRLEKETSVEGIPGLVYRDGDSIAFGPPRDRVRDLDALASPFDSFPSHTLVTSRGCFGRCTFCASEMIWGRKITSYSVGRVLDMLEQLVNGHGLQILAIKDEVFTSRRRRVLEVCEAIVARQLPFLWSCDTRVDRVDEEILQAMRLAGCQMISFGVESGSPKILETLKKNTTPEQTIEATELAKRFGLEVRYFLMYGCPGETPETIVESIDLINTGKPTSVVFVPFAISPGTEDYRGYVHERGVDRDFFFRGDFLSRPRVETASEEHRVITDALGEYRGLSNVWAYGLDDYEDIVERIPESPAAHLDLGCALLREGRLDEAERELEAAAKLDFPVQSLLLNAGATLAIGRGDLGAAREALEQASRLGSFRVVQENTRALRRWIAKGGERSGEPLDLVCHANFAVESFPFDQPLLPGPI